MTAITIRSATPDDAPQIARLLHQLGYPVDPEALAERLRSLLSDPDKAVWVAQTPAGGIVGCEQAAVDLRLAEGARIEITSLVVDATAQGTGVGRCLTEAAEAWGRSKGLDRLRVRCNARREGAHRFYEGTGFRETKSQKVFDKALAGRPGD
jgi:ribosomal protein S18 acetylase RimI-like enzyme